MSNLIVSKTFEIDPYDEAAGDSWYWDDVNDVAYEIIKAAVEKKKCLAWVSAGNIDWRGHSGYKVFDINENDYEEFWQEIAGISGDWTLRAVTDVYKGKNFGVIVSHHDAPTGGLRSVRLMSAKTAYRRLRFECDILRRDIVEHYDTYTYSLDQGDKPTNEDIYAAIEYAGADWYQELVESA